MIEVAVTRFKFVLFHILNCVRAGKEDRHRTPRGHVPPMQRRDGRHYVQEDDPGEHLVYVRLPRGVGAPAGGGLAAAERVGPIT